MHEVLFCFQEPISEGSMIEVVWAKPVDKADYARTGRTPGGFGRGLFPEVINHSVIHVSSLNDLI